MAHVISGIGMVNVGWKLRTGAKRAAPVHIDGSPPRALPVVAVAQSHGLRRASTARRSTGSAVEDAVLAPFSIVPVVKIDNMTDPFASIVTVEYGDKTGDLFDMITALKNLGLNIRKAKLTSGKSNKFFITEAETSDKIVKSARLEEIRRTVITSLVSRFPESASVLAKGHSMDSGDEGPRPLGTRKVVSTTISIEEASNGACSVLHLETADRPGLLVDIVRVLKDINLNVVSAEVDTVGDRAKDDFFLTYHGEPLTSPMQLLVTNALQYYLSLAEVANVDSY